MKKTIVALAILLAASGTVTTSYAKLKHGKTKKHQTVKTYTCPMHPEVKSTKPGKCPKCGMNLELATSKKK
jgi:hypothetical protein